MPHLLFMALALLSSAEPPANPPAPPATALDVVTALETVLADAIAKAEPSVVAIAREKSSDGEETTAVRGLNPAGRLREPQVVVGNIAPFEGDPISFDYGSGVVVGERGEILTAFHVVKGASRLVVRAFGLTPFEAEIIAADPRSDLAVIAPRRIPGVAMPTLKPLALGDATRLRKGSFLLALGNPFNAARDGRPSAGWGILSNVARRLEPQPEDLMQGRRPLSVYPTLLQLDAKLNLGMSGGAVINLKGELVGLTTASANAAGFDAQAGYAVPMDALGRRLVETLRQGKEFEYGFLGIQLDGAGTNRVANAQPGTPAGEGGVQTDDAILAVGDVLVSNADELALAINGFPPGVPIKLKLRRGDEVVERTVELAKFPAEEGVIATTRPPAWRGIHVDYASTLPNVGFTQSLLSALARGGVAVLDVAPGSPGEKAGLKRGQVITHVRGRKIRNPRDFAQAIGEGDLPVSLTTDLGTVEVK
jgi:serine protease Do